MRELPFNTFASNIKTLVDQAIKDKQTLRIIRRSGRDFMVVPVEDWENEQETVYVLQNYSLMKQITESEDSHESNIGYIPQKDELDEIIGI